MAELNETSLLADANLQGYYRFVSGSLGTDETANSRDMADGSARQNATTTANGKFDDAADFTDNENGVGGANLTITSEDFDIGLGDFSFNLWVKRSVEISTAVDTFLEHQFDGGAGASDARVRLIYEYNSGTRRINYNRKAGADASVYKNVTLGTTDWHMITITYDSTDVRAYYNGDLVDSFTSSGASGITSTSSLSIASGGGWWKGYIDDLAVFDRELTQSEITTLFSDAEASNARLRNPLFFSGGLTNS